MMATTTESVLSDEKERLINAVKKEVKQIMEEAVTRKFVHEESSVIASLCAVVEECLHNGLKKRALGLFKNSTTMALLQKVSKSFEPAANIVKLVTNTENNAENKKSFDSNRNLSVKSGWTVNQRHLWIRLALFEKVLSDIIEYLVQSANKYYEKDALLSDPVHGPILASLLVGPCALEYTKMKTPDHYWTDPPADELVQRHRIHSSTNHQIRATSPKRPGLQVQVKSQTSSSSDDSMRSGPLSAKDYVESLHQNYKSTLLYGKNNVIVQPKEDVEPLAGYLSLHQGFDGLCLKWTPNQLMNGCCEEEDDQAIDRSLYWDYAVTVYLDEIVYLHCHQQPDRGGTIVLVGQDGVQRPPIHFPKGGHLLAFLTCLENGLLPHGQLDPPLWTQRGKGKVFPKLRRKASRLSNLSSGGSQLSECGGSIDASLAPDEEETTDYVFRIITTFRPDNIHTEMLNPKAKLLTGLTSGRIGGYLWPTREIAEPVPAATGQSPPDSTIQSYARTQQEFNHSCICHAGHQSAVKQLCDTMTKQIRSRAFYGWLSHCRHLKTVRTHLSGLVNATIVTVDEPCGASKGLTLERWREMNKDEVVPKETAQELYQLVYYGGCAHEARKEVWPYLLGHHKFGTTASERRDTDDTQRCQYEQTMSEWLAIEVIVRQRDKETMAANLAKLSSGSQDGGGHIPLVRKDSNLSNDVFMSVESDDYVPPETLPEESSNATSSPDGDTANSVIDVTTRGSVDVDDDDAAKGIKSASDEGLGDSIARFGSVSDSRRSDSCGTDRNVDSVKSESDDSVTGGDTAKQRSIIVTGSTLDIEDQNWEESDEKEAEGEGEGSNKQLLMTEDGDQLRASKDSLVPPSSPASNASTGGVYSTALLDNMTVNLHRIDKDVQRCDRNYCYFTPSNLDKLRNVMCTYVWENLDVGYIQGMCDLVAPLLVIFDDEAMAYSCFCQLMKRMSSNFPHGGAMDQHFANMRSLIQILDPELFEHMHHNGDYTHFYFCYRWFLLDFKRELLYDDVFTVWETVWVARHISSPHFVLFIALALVEYYREIIIDNNMDFTDIIKFFNEMAERHNVKQVTRLARDLVHKLQDLIDNK